MDTLCLLIFSQRKDCKNSAVTNLDLDKRCILCRFFLSANVRYTIGKIVRKEGCWRGEKGSKVQGGAQLILHSNNFTAPVKYKYRTGSRCREMMGSAASCGVPIPICQININHSQSPHKLLAPSPLFPHLSPPLIDEVSWPRCDDAA